MLELGFYQPIRLISSTISLNASRVAEYASTITTVIPAPAPRSACTSGTVLRRPPCDRWNNDVGGTYGVWHVAFGCPHNLAPVLQKPKRRTPKLSKWRTIFHFHAGHRASTSIVDVILAAIPQQICKLAIFNPAATAGLFDVAPFASLMVPVAGCCISRAGWHCTLYLTDTSRHTFHAVAGRSG